MSTKIEIPVHNLLLFLVMAGPLGPCAFLKSAVRNDWCTVVTFAGGLLGVNHVCKKTKSHLTRAMISLVVAVSRHERLPGRGESSVGPRVATGHHPGPIQLFTWGEKSALTRSSFQR
jgi:hypothetical protein